MPKGVRLNQETFLEKVNEIFKGRLDFSEAVFNGQDTPITVICPTHGKYETNAKNVLSGYGCKKCAMTIIKEKMSDTKEIFIEKSEKVHGKGTYDYSKVVYINNNIKVEIGCGTHGSFWVLPRTHISGHKCPKCQKVGSDREYFIERAINIHKGKYSYDNVVYVRSNENVEITCPSHDAFWQQPNAHLSGHGCNKCYAEQVSRDKRSLVFGIGINDVPEFVYHKDGTMLESYQAWVQMLRRCYDQEYQKGHATYIGCSVAEEWHLFSNFLLFYNNPENKYFKGFHLDKDICGEKGNKLYSPENCCFLPPPISSINTKSTTLRGDTLIGVSRVKDRFRCRFSKRNKLYDFGLYDTEIEAFNVYKIEKEKHIKELADEYFEKGLITKRVKDALYRYRIDIND